jgi:DNA topoisomerase IB
MALVVDASLSTRLRRVRCTGPGFGRVRSGRGFRYVDEDGRPIREPEVVSRLRSLAIPPAWTNVWICADPNGHLQAVGTDDAGRRQYLYHERWRARRDRQKFERMVRFGQVLPDVRDGAERDLAREDLGRDQVLACALELMDLAVFRVGSETYAEANGSFGLATLRKRDVRVEGDAISFDFIAKGGKRQSVEVRSDVLAPLVRRLKERRGGGRELLAYREGGVWRDVRSADINAHLKAAAGEEFSAKDFRTFHATVLAAVGLARAELGSSSVTSRKRAVSAVIKDVAGFLGNTPAVCRASYVDPRVIDRFQEGRTIDLTGLDPESIDREARERIEAAVLDLLGAGRALRAAA